MNIRLVFNFLLCLVFRYSQMLSWLKAFSCLTRRWWLDEEREGRRQCGRCCHLVNDVWAAPPSSIWTGICSAPRQNDGKLVSGSVCAWAVWESGGWRVLGHRPAVSHLTCCAARGETEHEVLKIVFTPLLGIREKASPEGHNHLLSCDFDGTAVWFCAVCNSAITFNLHAEGQNAVFPVQSIFPPSSCSALSGLLAPLILNLTFCQSTQIESSIQNLPCVDGSEHLVFKESATCFHPGSFLRRKKVPRLWRCPDLHISLYLLDFFI